MLPTVNPLRYQVLEQDFCIEILHVRTYDT